MSTLERSKTVHVPIHRVEKCWTRFVAHQIVHERPLAENGEDPGTVHFTDAGGGRTEVTILVPGDEPERVDSYLEDFKRFAEQQ